MSQSHTSFMKRLLIIFSENAALMCPDSTWVRVRTQGMTEGDTAVNVSFSWRYVDGLS